MDSVDLLIMGRHTYEKVLTFGDWPYGKKRVVILSSQPMQLSARLVEIVSCSSVVPVLIGAGKPPFGPLDMDTSLTRVSTQTFDFGYVQLK